MSASHTIKRWRHSAALHWRMTRPAFLLITLAACAAGIAIAVADTGVIHIGRALITVLLACVAHAGANVLNDWQDARNGADAANRDGIYPFTGGARLIQQGVASEQQTARWSALLLLALLPAGSLLALAAGPQLAAVGAAGLFIAWAYSAPPLQLMSRGLGEPSVGVAWWLVVIGADCVQRGQLAAAPALLGLSTGLLVACILLINGFPDARADASVGKRTLAVRLGARNAAILYVALMLGAHAWLAACAVIWDVLPGAAWALLSLPPGGAAAALLWRHRAQPARLKPALALTIASANLHALALAAGLLLCAPG